ncbi:hypothetical protein [Pyxidicoccus xibeiensis]|uniref:hypothetical protein n=1 Tax=Pyxidicoccus xibeiensis TaxID=2906759 RepID=UPI0020A7594E|nr:hypothetical protein [Pyxidicoccus xibeiensis]MCP3140034.1 hypothetical protein [Pyxidicoccus xibeiensis]
MRRGLGLACAVLLLAAGCIPEARLQPTTGARVLQGDRDAATAAAAGVELVADGAAWKGSPGNLERSLTPVFVKLDNRGSRPLRLQYEDFALVGGESRFRYAALPPFSLGTGNASREQGIGGSGRTSLHPGFSSGMWPYGPFGSYGPYSGGRWGPYTSPFFSPFYPDPYYSGYACQEPLPTQDMLERALPEGTLGAGGHVEGFLYFPNVSERESQVVLQARLVDAETGKPLGTLDIPFQVREG